MKGNNVGRLAVITVSEKGKEIEHLIISEFRQAAIYPVSAFNEEIFDSYDRILFIGALGICVRSISPYIKNKVTDPAVINIDSTGRFVIPVISGHIGGANQLAVELAHLIGGQPVITTQSDNSGLWALDILGDKFGWTTESYDITGQPALSKGIALFVGGARTALLLNVRNRGSEYLERTCPDFVTIFYDINDIDFHDFEFFISVGPYKHPSPIPTIAFYPKVLHLGIGCRRNMAGDVRLLQEEIENTLSKFNLSTSSIQGIATIDIKADEPVIHSLSEAYGVPLTAFRAEALREIEVPNPSERVREATSSPSVSEAASLLASNYGKLLVEKQKRSLCKGQEYTFAIALDGAACREGHIEIVGAGPGDPELISVRGKHMLENADLILYAGSLVPKELTHYAKEGAVVRSSANMTLEEQFALMKSFYDKGLFVVRLHTGDPCIYGAIQEQMAYFDQYRMHYHITPGISSFQAAAAALNSQFTIPEKTQTIILTRGEGRTPMPEKEQLHKLAQSQSTMCIFLSAAIVDEVQKELQVHYSPQTPVAVCYKLTWKDERIYRGELKDLARLVKENNLTLTTLLVIGEAIDNRKGLSRLYADEFKHLFRG